MEHPLNITAGIQYITYALYEYKEYTVRAELRVAFLNILTRYEMLRCVWSDRGVTHWQSRQCLSLRLTKTFRFR